MKRLCQGSQRARLSRHGARWRWTALTAPWSAACPDDVDAMDEASSAGVEKVSLQRTRPPRPRGTRTPRAPASACSVAIFTVDVPTYKQGAHGFCETFEPIASYFSQHAVDSRRAPLRQPVIGAIDRLPWPRILPSADRVRSLAHGEAEACARTPPILPSSSNSPR